MYIYLEKYQCEIHPLCCLYFLNSLHQSILRTFSVGTSYKLLRISWFFISMQTSVLYCLHHTAAYFVIPKFLDIRSIMTCTKCHITWCSIWLLEQLVKSGMMQFRSAGDHLPLGQTLTNNKEDWELKRGSSALSLLIPMICFEVDPP
jgi:hypothetical protein